MTAKRSMRLAGVATIIVAAALAAATTNGSGASAAAVTVVAAGATSNGAGAINGASATSVGRTAEAATIPAPATGFQFGVQTHFSQGWQPSWLALTSQIGTRVIRDTVNWASVEKTPGTYVFTGTAIDTLAGFCATGGKLSLTIVPRNALYDDGKMVYSTAGQAAFATYLRKLLDRFGGCVTALEIGNEINGNNALDYPAGYDQSQTYVATLRAMYQPLKTAHPEVSILGGSTNTIGTGFLDKMFAAGMLDVVDGVAVHPYRPEAEGIDLEITHLNDVMRRYGTPKPVWATEYSYGVPDPRLASASLVKSVLLLYASGVTHANWYALVEQSGFPYMGLFASNTIKPVGVAYRAVVDHILPFGAPVRVNLGTRPIYLYKIGADRYVVWGGGGTIAFTGTTTLRDMYGAVIPGGAGGAITIRPEPVIVSGATGYTLGEDSVIADTLLQYGVAPWTYLRRNGAGKNTALDLFDNKFTSYFGDIWSQPLRINTTSAAPSGDGAAPMRAVIRYTAPKAMQVDLNACFMKAVAGDGVDYRIERNGVALATGVLIDKIMITALPVNVAAGDRIEISFGPNKTYGNDLLSYHATLNKRGAVAPALCYA